MTLHETLLASRGRDRRRLAFTLSAVAGLVARGLTNRRIAEVLVVSEGTAANYVQRVMARLNVHNRAQVAAWAVEQRLHEPSSALDHAR